MAPDRFMRRYRTDEWQRFGDEAGHRS
jgi:hypothetical protein